MIRGSTIKYSSQRKKQWQEEEAKLEQGIKLIEEVNANFLNLSEDVLDELENKKSLLNEIQKEKIEGVLLRSPSRYDEDVGEKPSHYFFNLEILLVKLYINW